MARFLFVTFDGGGNHPPTIGIAAELKRRGHSVTVAGYETQRSRFEDAGLSFTTLPRSGSYVQPEGDPMAVRMAHLRGVLVNPHHLTDVPELAVGHDAIVVDFLMLLAQSAAAGVPQPSAVLFHTAAETYKPSPLRAPLLAALNEIRQGQGLGPVTGPLDVPGGIDEVIVATLPELDEYSRNAAPNWHWVGPVRGPAPESLDDVLFESADHRPMVLVGLTTHTGWGPQTDRLQRILEALSTLQVRVVATTGAMIDPRSLTVPANAVVRKYLSHRALMRETAVCITHAGHGTLTEALAHGVPLVCLPNPWADQAYLAGRVSALGAGLHIDEDSPPSAIREAVQTVLSSPTYRQAAESLKAQIGEGGAGRAAEVLEAMVRVQVARGAK